MVPRTDSGAIALDASLSYVPGSLSSNGDTAKARAAVTIDDKVMRFYLDSNAMAAQLLSLARRICEIGATPVSFSTALPRPRRSKGRVWSARRRVWWRRRHSRLQRTRARPRNCLRNSQGGRPVRLGMATLPVILAPSEADHSSSGSTCTVLSPRPSARTATCYSVAFLCSICTVSGLPTPRRRSVCLAIQRNIIEGVSGDDEEDRNDDGGAGQHSRGMQQSRGAAPTTRCSRLRCFAARTRRYRVSSALGRTRSFLRWPSRDSPPVRHLPTSALCWARPRPSSGGPRGSSPPVNQNGIDMAIEAAFSALKHTFDVNTTASSFTSPT